MTTPTSINIPAKPRVLIADDSRIVRATLCKQVESMYEIREAVDGEQAWETLLIDPNIQVVITDLTMPKLDGYGLLQRIRSSKISRIRNIPVVVISGSNEKEDRDRAKAAGATDLITKGIGTAQLLSRLDMLSKLIARQGEFERSLTALVSNARIDPSSNLSSPDSLQAQAELMMVDAARNKKDFVMLSVSIGLKHAALEGGAMCPPASVVDAIGQLLQRTVRQTDCVAKTGEAEFALATGSMNFDSARFFAQRICRTVAKANLVQDDQISFVACCGLVSLSDYGIDATAVTLDSMCETARRRAILGLDHAVTGVIGADEEAALQRGEQAETLQSRDANEGASAPDLATLLQWIKEGKQELVLSHIGKLSAELQPLVDLVLKKDKQ